MIYFLKKFFIILITSYILGFFLISLDPYFDDNGSLEYIHWQERLILAIYPMGLFSIIGILLFILYKCFIKNKTHGIHL